MTLASLSFRRHRSGGNSKKNKYSPRYEARWGKPVDTYNPRSKFVKPEPRSYYDIPNIDPNNIPAFFEEQVKEWSLHRGLPPRLQSFGIPQDEVEPLLKAFVRAVTAGELSTPEGHHEYVLGRFVQHLDGDPVHAIDVIYNTILFTWASKPAQVELLRSVGLSPDTISKIQAVAEAGDRWFPADDFPETRKRVRKVIMHVGPTNSGKTYNALRALAAAETGVYAGPLRLLAHEIWERLNLGQIVPAGIEEEPPKATTVDTDTDTALDVAGVKRQGNPKYARVCNMKTGEEMRIVDDFAPLLSCTVEMLSLYRALDVAVIDEIQMIADPERGSAWTSAVLGVCAKEVHLCGEETAVPIIEALLKDTGDELVINRYERLSPLHLQEETLNGDLSQVKKGDCIVTFSRSSIFKLKREIERRSPLRCAVVYGRLPPEIRSEQAALFNDPDSGYDVLIGSDAVGMGLNLKIRRVIFESTSKFQGSREAPLSISQTKQIAGRAGRYGLHGNDPPGGYVTAFSPKDIPHIEKAINMPPQPLKSARIGINTRYFQAFALALPPNSPTKTILDAYYYTSRIPIHLRQQMMNNQVLEPLCKFVDDRLNNMPSNDVMLFLNAPIAIRDTKALEITQKFLRAYQDDMTVDLWKCLDDSPLIADLKVVEELQAEANPRGVNTAMLEGLESLHKAVVLYVWMCFRRPVSWFCFEEVRELKQRVEKALDWGLQAVTRSQPGKDWKEYTEERRKGMERGVVYRHAFLKSMPTAQPIDPPKRVSPGLH
ncbi:hypothetical protein C0995_012292 [Termitomyces sp. Mi166|nr:hypothetical protein C0995_012292 [Termitomyces sp. Mi166\